jgi:hypothetical protein
MMIRVTWKAHLDTDRKSMKWPHWLAVAFQIIIQIPRSLEGLVEEYLRQAVGLCSPESV